MTPEETKEFESYPLFQNLLHFINELTRLVCAGNADGQRVTELHAQVIYQNGEVYSHSVMPNNPRDTVLALGAMASAMMSMYHETNNEAWSAIKKAGAEKGWPPPRRELELGFRFGSNTRGIIERALAEANRQARDAGHAFEDEPS